MGSHVYTAKLTWTGNRGDGTTGYRGFSRDYDIVCEGKPVIKGSSDPNYLGDGGAPARDGQRQVLHRPVRQFPGQARGRDPLRHEAEIRSDGA